LSAASELKPDVVVLDIGMPLLNGLDAARQLKRTMPEVKIVVLTINEDPDLAADAIRAGASCYLLKNSAASELLTAIDEAMRGRSYITPLVAKGLVDALARGPGESAEPALSSPRQREVLQLLAEGRTMKEIGRILKITPRTVAFHKYGMMKQLGVRSTAELVKTALKLGVVSA
jgi:DNA-binding NarL/FixJ family response regulator